VATFGPDLSSSILGGYIVAAYCERGSFTEAINEVSARAWTTRRLRTQIGAAIGEAALSGQARGRGAVGLAG